MKRLMMLITLTGFCFFQEFPVEAQQQEKPKEPPQKTQTQWTAKIVEAFQPETVKIDQSFPSRIIGMPESPPAKKKWLLVTVELQYSTTEGENKDGYAGVLVNTIGVSEDSSEPNHSLSALGFAGDQSLAFVRTFPGLYKSRMTLSPCGKLQMITQVEVEGEKKLVIAVSKNCAATYRLLFPVAEGAKQFSLHLSEGYRVPITIGNGASPNTVKQ